MLYSVVTTIYNLLDGKCFLNFFFVNDGIVASFEDCVDVEKFLITFFHLSCSISLLDGSPFYPFTTSHVTLPTARST